MPYMRSEEESRMNTLCVNSVKSIARIAIVPLIVILSGCATNSIPAISVEAAVPAHEYLIGPGDSVNINVWRNPEVSQTVPVRPDGKITTPLVEDLPASGKTATQLARDIEKVLGKYIQQPVVTVIVTGFVGPYSQQIRVLGQAAKPQALPYRQGMSLMDVMIAVGGLAEFASGNRANVVRHIDGKQQKIDVRLNDLIKKGDISANMPMRPGDVLIIPESFF
jgi:polysaccharide export outer membrane protein